MNFREFFQQYTSSILFVLAAAKASDAQGASVDFAATCQDLAARFKAAHDAGGKIFILGNGGSAAIASHQAYDYWKNGKLRVMAFNDSSLLTGSANDFGYQDVFTKALEMFATKQDIVIAISSSGQSANIVNAAKKAKEIGCYAVTFSAFKHDNPLRSSGDANLYLDTAVYGFAELGHETILHSILDFHIEKMKGNAV
jgi:D-sedoheptulose 7-phosphate isomerase